MIGKDKTSANYITLYLLSILLTALLYSTRYSIYFLYSNKIYREYRISNTT